MSALERKIIIEGSASCGKSFILRRRTEYLREQGKKVFIVVSNVECIYCGSTSVYNDFENKNGVRWRCIECKKEFIMWKDDGDVE